MAFFDRFARAVNETSQNALQRGREMAEGAKVSSRIAEVQNELSQCYQGLGERYYAAFRQEEREELRPFVQQITDLLQQMEQLKEEQRSLRGLVACPNCGEDIPKNSVFCPNCGGRAITQDVSRCKNCGAIAPAEAAFCIHCGEQMEFISGIDAEPQTQEQRKICAKCGAALEADSQFCTACGARVEEKTVMSAVEDWPLPAEEPRQQEEKASVWTNRAPTLPTAEEALLPVADGDLEQPILLPEQSEEQEWDWEMPPRNERRGENLIPEAAWAEPTTVPKPTPAAHTCPQCGVTLEEEQVFCHNCGCKLAQGDRR